MKRLLILVALTVCIATAKGQESFNITQLGDTLELCDYITQVTIEKDPDYLDTPFWFDGNGNVIHNDFVMIDSTNIGKIAYIEIDNCTMKCVNISYKPNEMPLPSQDTAWLKESVWQEPLPLTLTATPEDMGYLYLWRSDCWPIDSTYQIYGLEVRRTGNYLGIMVDECLHDSQKAFLVDKAPVLDYVSTNLNQNLNELHWAIKGSTYDSVGIIKDDSIVAICSKYDGSWIDPISNNQFGTNAYKLATYLNGKIIPESSSFWRTGVTLSVLPDTDTTLCFNFFGPNTEEGVAFNGYIKFFRLYSNEELIVDSIPNNYNAIFDIKNDHETWYIAAVLWNGREIYSNIVTTEYIMSNSEKTADKIQVFPNPVTNGILCISTDDAAYRIYNANGQQVKSGRCSQRLDISDLSSGVYAIEIREKQSTTTIKTIKFIVE